MAVMWARIVLFAPWQPCAHPATAPAVSSAGHVAPSTLAIVRTETG